MSYFHYCTRLQYKTVLSIRGLVSEDSKQMLSGVWNILEKYMKTTLYQLNKIFDKDIPTTNSPHHVEFDLFMDLDTEVGT